MKNPLPSRLAAIVPGSRYVVVVDDADGTRIIGPFLSRHTAKTYAHHAPLRLQGVGVVTVHPLASALEELDRRTNADLTRT